MKKVKQILTALFLVLAMHASAQGYMVHKSDGTKMALPYTAVDSITLYTAAAPNPDGVPTEGLAIDLGLPSGTKWASHNIGATNPEDYGDYYAWGETEIKSDYSENTYLYFDSGSLTYIDIGSDIAGTQYDVAYIKWGNSWKMPTHTQQQELVSKCTWTWTTLNNVRGYKVEGPNGNSIFLPAAGYRRGTSLYYAGSDGNYWSSSLLSSSVLHALFLSFYSPGHNVVYGNNGRIGGQSVRPVSE